MQEVWNWLLEDSNPAVKWRTKTELMEQEGDKTPLIEWIFSKLPCHWIDTKGLWFTYYMTSFAECGLSYEDIPSQAIEKALAIYDKDIDSGCADFMLLTALMKLGISDHPMMRRIIDELGNRSLPDGGYVCQRIIHKLDYTPKSCYKADVFALFFVAECKKKGVDITAFQPLIEYFFRRNLFYKSTNPAELVINAREGWRTIDTFYPFEPMRVGLQNVIEAFCALGYGNDERLQEGWALLHSHKDESGKVILKQTLTKSYLPKTREKPGKPSKWVTFYTLLAEKERNENS